MQVLPAPVIYFRANTDLMQSWTDPAKQRASTEGWNLADTIDNGDTHVYLLVCATDTRFKNSQQATTYVVERARSGSTFHQQALRLMTISRLRPTKKRGK